MSDLHRQYIKFTYIAQAFHCWLGAIHLWLLIFLPTNSITITALNSIMLGVNAVAFVNNARAREIVRDKYRRRGPWRSDAGS